MVKSVVDLKHRYHGLAADAPLGGQGDRLPKDAFKEDPKKRSLPFASIASTSAKAPWYSPAPERNNTPVADLQLLRDVRPDWNKVKFAFLGKLLDVKHRIAVQLVSAKYPDVPEGFHGEKWAMGLHAFPDSSCVVWPVRRQVAPSGTEYYFDGVTDRKKVLFYTLVSTMHIQAVTYTWRSWCWQLQNYDKRMVPFGAAVRAWFDDQPANILVVAALKSFWRMSLNDMRVIARFRDIPLRDDTDIVLVIVDKLMFILEITELEAIERSAVRLAEYEEEFEWIDELFEIDEAVSVLNRDDQDTCMKSCMALN